MINRSKAIAVLTATATLLAAGSAFAVKTMAPITPAVADVATCAATASPTAALTFDTRWNGLWQPASSDLGRLGWVNCSSGWEFGYLTNVDLSTLPIMR